MKSAILLSVALGFLAILIDDASLADGTGSAKDARTMCLNKVGTDPAKLQSCCDDAILVDPASKQKRLVHECVTGVSQAKSQEELNADQRQKDDLAAERKRRTDNEAHGGKVSRKASGATSTPTPAPPVDPPAAPSSPTTAVAAAGAAPATVAPEPAAADPLAAATKAQADCRNSKSHAAAASLASMARRLGARVPSTDCP
jgi:hypothetical protein